MLEIKRMKLKNISGGDCYYAGERYSNGAKLDNGQVCVGDSWQ
jgi:hypothetical protein